MKRIYGLLVGVAIAGSGAAGCSTLEAAPSEGASPSIDNKVASLPPTPLAGAAKLDKALSTYFGTLGGQRTYIQTDKPLYQPGETVWFRTDVRAAGVRAVGLAEGEAEAARLAAYRDLPPALLQALALRELAGHLPDIGQLTVTPDVVTGLLNRLG